MERAAWDDLLYGINRNIPRCFTVNRIVQVPAKSIYATAAVNFFYIFRLQFKRYMVNIAATVQFQPGQVPAVKGRVGAGYTFYV